jgi:proteasome accessory factor B
MERLERLVNLVAALIDTDRPLTRADIRERIEGYSEDPEAFRRNFERDKELLRQLGLPLSTEPVGQGGSEETGYRIPRERYELPDPGLDDAELAALRLAASAVHLESPWAEDAITRALRKLGGAAGGAPGDGTGPAGRLAALPGGDSAATAFAAIGERRRLRFCYRGQERRVDPWSLSFRRGRWYLAGFDHSRQEERLFRLDRVEGPVEPEGPAGAFERPPAAPATPPAAWMLGEDDELVAELAADAGHARFVREALGGEGNETANPDGSVVVRFPVRNVAAFRSLALEFLDHVEVLGPPSLRADFESWLEGIASDAGGRDG